VLQSPFWRNILNFGRSTENVTHSRQLARLNLALVRIQYDESPFISVAGPFQQGTDLRVPRSDRLNRPFFIEDPL
jgi:hypothetical protein